MARVVNLNDEDQIENNVTTFIKSSLGSVYTGKDSVINLISETFSSEIINLKRENEFLFDQSQLSNASNENLDRLAFEMYKINRKPSAKARVQASEKNLHFYVDVGTFGDINQGVAINIPAGTIVSVDPEGFNDSSIAYEIIYDYTLEPEDTHAFCTAQALNPGSYANTNSNTLNYHNFTTYSDSLGDSLKITNRYPIITGADLESDDSLRFRVANYFQATTAQNTDAIRLAALSVNGIDEVNIVPNYFGIGTVGVIVFGAGRENNPRLLTLLEAKLSELNIVGRGLEIVQGIKVFLDFTMRVYIKPGLTDLNKNNVKTAIREAVFTAIKTAEFTNEIDFLEISRRIINANRSVNINSFGTNSSKNNIFESVFARKTDRFDLFPEEKFEIRESSFRVGVDERIAFGEINIILEEDLR